MKNRFALTLVAFAASASSAWAHITNLPHAHPHAMDISFSGETAAVVTLSALAALFCAGHLIPKVIKTPSSRQRGRR